MYNENNCNVTTLLGLFYDTWRSSSSTEFAKRNKRVMSLKTIIIIIMQSDVLSSIDIQSWWCTMLLLILALMTHVSLQFGWSCSFEQMKYSWLLQLTSNSDFYYFNKTRISLFCIHNRFLFMLWWWKTLLNHHHRHR